VRARGHLLAVIRLRSAIHARQLARKIKLLAHDIKASGGLPAKSVCRFQPAGFGVAILLRHFPWFGIGVQAAMRSAKGLI
jgi:hypothetical protein